MKPKLALKRERLTELTAADLTQVAGGQEITGVGLTCPLTGCPDLGITETSCRCCTASGSC